MNVKKMQGKIEYKENLAGSTWLLGVSFSEVAMYIPGQFVSLKVNDEGLHRSYSVASLPGKKTIDLVVDVSPDGIGSKYIIGLAVGEVVEIIGYLGKFVVNEEAFGRKEILFVGTGTGIAPIKPMIENLLVNKQYKGRVNLIWGMRFETDLYWQNEIDKLQREFDNFHFEIVLSKPGDDWPGLRGHVGEVIETLDKEWKEIQGFLCGNPQMIVEIKENLLSKGVPEGQIQFERFA